MTRYIWSVACGRPSHRAETEDNSAELRMISVAVGRLVALTVRPPDGHRGDETEGLEQDCG